MVKLFEKKAAHLHRPKSKTQSKTQPVTHDASQTVPTTNTQTVQQVYLGRGRGQPKTPAKSKGVGKGKGRGKKSKNVTIKISL